MIGYETVFITHPDLEEADLKKSLKKFKDIIKNGKGKLVHEYLWGRRRLAYQIANQNHGVYHIWYLQGTGAILDELQTQFRYSDEVLRFQTVKVDDLDQEAGFFSKMLKAQQEEAAARSAPSITKTASPESSETNSDEAETSSAKEETPDNATAESAEESPKEDQAADESEAAKTENTEA
ncbi:MAG: 30S ribosomal protein S6 [SAR324 cluster bacterium]|nr:30S ribosomal protein S6 [SAR324 cluster bacterium]